MPFKTADNKYVLDSGNITEEFYSHYTVVYILIRTLLYSLGTLKNLEFQFRVRDCLEGIESMVY